MVSVMNGLSDEVFDGKSQKRKKVSGQKGLWCRVMKTVL